MSSISNTILSYYANCRDTSSSQTSLRTSLIETKRGAVKGPIEGIRKSKSKAEKEQFKRNLPAVTFGGEFKGRTELVKASGLACLDFDKVKDLNSYIRALGTSEYIFSFWLSPSGNGFKALVRIPEVTDKEEYQGYYKAILEHFRELNPDEATKDITRLCFLSYDPDLYLNKNAKVFTEKVAEEVKEFKPIKTSEVAADLPEGKIVDRLLRWWMKNYNFTNGGRNNSLFILACSLSNFGVNKATTEELFYSFEDKDFTYSEIQKLINSAYKKAEFNSKSFAQ